MELIFMVSLITVVLSYIVPQKVVVVRSEIQGDILVEYYRGEYRVTVDSYWQSGAYARNVMRVALNGLSTPQESVRKLLFLGIGPGSMIEVIRKVFSSVHITGVDIDPMMLNIGRRYFHVQNDDRMRLVVSDAFEYVKNMKKNELYQMIVSDLFIGCDTGENLRSREFVSGIYTHLEDGGVYISNSSYIEQYKEQTDVFIKNVREVFDSVDVISCSPNRVIRGYKH